MVGEEENVNQARPKRPRNQEHHWLHGDVLISDIAKVEGILSNVEIDNSKYNSPTKTS